eukprot:scaffold111010_cov17-Tisochrysis_lutea.AAC.1
MPGGSPEAYAPIKDIMEKVAAQSTTTATSSHPGSAASTADVPNFAVAVVGYIVSPEPWQQECCCCCCCCCSINCQTIPGPQGKDLDRAGRGPSVAQLEPVQHQLTCLLACGASTAHTAGKWTVQQAAELSTATPTITASLDGRYMSAIKPERVEAAKLYSSLNLNAPTAVPGVNKAQLIEDVAAALYASKICSYAQVGGRPRLLANAILLLFLESPGRTLLTHLHADPADEFPPSTKLMYYVHYHSGHEPHQGQERGAKLEHQPGGLGTHLEGEEGAGSLVQCRCLMLPWLWSFTPCSVHGGCIIRAVFLEEIHDAYKRNPQLPNLLVDPEFAKKIAQRDAGWRRVVRQGACRQLAAWSAHACELVSRLRCSQVNTAISAGVPVPGLSASLSYFDTYRRDRLPANLVQYTKVPFKDKVSRLTAEPAAMQG